MLTRLPLVGVEELPVRLGGQWGRETMCMQMRSQREWRRAMASCMMVYTGVDRGSRDGSIWLIAKQRRTWRSCDDKAELSAPRKPRFLRPELVPRFKGIARKTRSGAAPKQDRGRRSFLRQSEPGLSLVRGVRWLCRDAEKALRRDKEGRKEKQQRQRRKETGRRKNEQ